VARAESCAAAGPAGTARRNAALNGCWGQLSSAEPSGGGLSTKMRDEKVTTMSWSRCDEREGKPLGGVGRSCCGPQCVK
jgi:hypothetical protein